LSYIPDEAKKQAAAAFESKFWEWLECYYKYRRIYLKEEIKFNEEKQKMLLRYEEIKKELDCQEKNEQNNVLLLRRVPQSGDLIQGNMHDSLAKKTMDYFREIHSKETALNKWHDELEAKIERFDHRENFLGLDTVDQVVVFIVLVFSVKADLDAEADRKVGALCGALGAVVVGKVVLGILFGGALSPGVGVQVIGDHDAVRAVGRVERDKILGQKMSAKACGLGVRVELGAVGISF